jgi:hypothetical protein
VAVSDELHPENLHSLKLLSFEARIANETPWADKHCLLNPRPAPQLPVSRAASTALLDEALYHLPSTAT